MKLQKAEVQKGRTPAAVLTTAVIRAGDHLQLSSAVVAKVIGVSTATVSRMRSGQYELDQKEKPFELAALFVRIFRSLDGIVGGDTAVAAQWMQAENKALRDKPVNLIQKVVGLTNVLQYLDSRRAIS